MRELAKIIHDPKAIAILERTRSLSEATLGSDVLVTNSIKRALTLLEDQANVLFTHIRHVGSEDLAEADSITRKLQGLAFAKNTRPEIPFVEADIERSPYNAILKSHFSSIHIDRYKSLKNISFGDLRRVNLVAGANNTGKTSILEAIYLLTQQNEVRALLEVVMRRGKVGKTADPAWLLQQIPDGAHIVGSFDDVPDNQAEWDLSVAPDSPDVEDKTFYLGTIAIHAKFSGRINRPTRIFLAIKIDGHSIREIAFSVEQFCRALSLLRIQTFLRSYMNARSRERANSASLRSFVIR
jgi:hypothetical protein